MEIISTATINSYDQFAPRWTAKLTLGENLAQTYIEKPAMYAKINEHNLQGKKVLCLGCGSGEECEYISKYSMADVVGIDISQGMLQEAIKKNTIQKLARMDMTHLGFVDESYDFVFASLSFYFFNNIDGILVEVYRVLKRGGILLFSMPHPVKWGALKINDENEKTYKMGFSYLKQDKTFEIWGDYLNVRQIKEIWFDNYEVTYFHHPISAIVNSLLASSFQFLEMVEPKAIIQARNEHEDFWYIHQKIPLFVIYTAKKI
jgi:ubiquinone/menaquinone biosynthesis C-methylase UbiE